jgi:hypothetical protein
MTTEEKIQEQRRRIKTAKTWGKRIDKLKDRGERSLTEADFCKKYGFNKAHFNRQKNCKSDFIPSKKTVERVEKALKDEGV